MLNPQLHDSLSIIVKLALEKIDTSIKQNLPVDHEYIWVKYENDSYVRIYTKKPLWFISFHQIEDELMKTDEYQNLLRVINLDRIISSQLNTLVGTYISSRRFELSNIIYYLVSKFLLNDTILDFDDSIFKIEYLIMEKCFHSNEIEFEKLTPLFGFNSDLDEIFINDQVSIVKLSDDEIAELLNLGIKIGNSFVNDDFITNVNKYFIKRKYTLKKSIGPRETEIKLESIPSEISNEIENKIIHALKVFNKGKFYSAGGVTKSKSFLSIGTTYDLGIQQKHFQSSTYYLNKQDYDNFIHFLDNFNKLQLEKKHFLNVALRRFSISTGRDDIEDKIIDLMICAEAIFLSSEGNEVQGELSYRLSHRASMFIEDRSKNPKDIFKFMKDAYTARSKIVHGATVKIPKNDNGILYTIEEFSDVLEDYIRFSLKKMIKLIIETNDVKNIDWNLIIFPIQ